MKISLVPAMKKLSEATKLILIINLLSGCAGIPANKVKISDYPEIDKERIEQLDISYVYNDFIEKREGEDPAKINTTTEAKLIKLGIKKSSEKQNTKCKIVTSMSSGVYDFWGCPIFTNILSIPTLTIIPYYCQIGFRGGAVLISHPKDSEISGTILPSISGAKPGDIFLDENNQPSKILKTYELKDKVHEVWSLLWMLSWLVVEPSKYSSIQNKYLDVGRHPDVAKIETENIISEALVRSILHDASNFKECQKPQPSTSKKK